MSDDTIKRSDAIKAVIKKPAWHGSDGSYYHADDIKDALENVPSADRPQGKWKAKSFHEYFCHNCGFSFDMMKCEFLENMKYCPNCGVRKGADNGE